MLFSGPALNLGHPARPAVTSGLGISAYESAQPIVVPEEKIYIPKVLPVERDTELVLCPSVEGGLLPLDEPTLCPSDEVPLLKPANVPVCKVEKPRLSVVQRKVLTRTPRMPLQKKSSGLPERRKEWPL